MAALCKVRAPPPPPGTAAVVRAVAKPALAVPDPADSRKQPGGTRPGARLRTEEPIAVVFSAVALTFSRYLDLDQTPDPSVANILERASYQSRAPSVSRKFSMSLADASMLVPRRPPDRAASDGNHSMHVRWAAFVGESVAPKNSRSLQLRQKTSSAEVSPSAWVPTSEF
ncbi:hypothetical protein PHLGIDRAFT_116464 [Phlebiopsis gigantea 11061_1 CR5-6]|uniref:Uncharacterized protein n=1 Tax=Phlebiopsis gigantea (strain 11061_1 CR5-6) TaxID=745531 RepID=A0A0C3S2B2_PHLG1|nr:hypothetical protein PHLGIDRAFT_116464 [Phlebiopsis gigantea 11061_1 CR5-6]